MEPSNGTNERTMNERTPLLPTVSKPLKSSRWGQLKKHMNDDVSKNWADLVLLWCYIITGLLDSSATVIWGSFVSMQTGL